VKAKTGGVQMYPPIRIKLTEGEGRPMAF